MSFADAEARATASAMARVSNARGDFGGSDFPIIFDYGYVDTDVGVTALSVSAVVEDSNLASVVPHTTVLRVDAASSYLVVNVLPDGAGMSRLILEEA